MHCLHSISNDDMKIIIQAFSLHKTSTEPHFQGMSRLFT